MAYVDLRQRREDRSRPKPEAPWQRILRDPLFLLASGFAAGSLASFFLSIFLSVFLAGSPGDLSPTFSLLLAALSLLVVLLCVFRRPSGGGEAVTPKAGSEKQLLMAIQDAGDGMTPVEAALETSLTVDEAERVLTRLADRGHLVVRGRDGVLAYALPGRHPSGTF